LQGSLQRSRGFSDPQQYKGTVTLESMIDKVMEILICGPIKTDLLDFEAMKKLHYSSRT